MARAVPSPRSSSLLPALAALLVVAAVFAWGWRTPLVEDALFWFYPAGALVAEHGPALAPHGALPGVVTCVAGEVPPPWAGGLPDFSHPPLWSWALGLGLWAFPGLVGLRAVSLAVGFVAALGFVRIARTLGSGWGGAAVWALPPLAAQLLRPELDLPLLALVPWVLDALLRRRFARLGVLLPLAPIVKEPGVLLAFAALGGARPIGERAVLFAAPFVGLGLWGAADGLAAPEYLVPLAALPRALFAAGSYVFVDQGRWLLTFAAVPVLWRRRELLVFVAVWTVFFAVVRFYAAEAHADTWSHVRHFGPALAVLAVAGASRWPWAPILGLLWLHRAHPLGPEASFVQLDAARAAAALSGDVAGHLGRGDRVWVGAYHAAGICTSGAGYADPPLHGFSVYSLGTSPEALRVGDYLVTMDFGEPTAALERAHPLTEVRAVEVHGAHARLLRVAP